MRAILKRACNEWEWLERVPKFKLFKETEGRVRSLTPQEFQTLLNELPEHLFDMVVFAVATGLRQANVKGLRWSQVDLERQHAWIPGFLDSWIPGFLEANTRMASRILCR